MNNVFVLLFASFILFTFNTFADDELKDKLEEIKTAYKNGKFDKAFTMAQLFHKANPKAAELADVLGNAGYAAGQKGNFDHTIKFYRMLVENFPESKHVKHANSELAACYSYDRKLKECIKQCQINLKLYPKSEWVEYWKFLIPHSQFRLWDFKESTPGLKAFLKEYPNGKYSSNAKKYLGMIEPKWEIDENGIVSYKGKLMNDIRMQREIKALPKYKKEAFKMLKERLGVDLEPHTNVIFTFKDVDPKTKGGLRASTFIVSRNFKPTIVIQFYSEYVVTNPEGFHRTVIHEIKHAGFIGVMGHAYDDLPKWVREGLALWGSNEIRNRIEKVLSNEIVAGRNPRVALDGIDDPKHNYRDYMEDVLAFEWLHSKDPENIKKFCQGLVKGETPEKLFAELSGMSYKEAMTEANTHCKNRVEAILGEGYNSFNKLRKQSTPAINKGRAAAKKLLKDGVRDNFEQWFKKNSGHPAEPMARMTYGQLLTTAGEYDLAREYFQKILKEDAMRCTLMDDAQFWIGLSYNHQRNIAKANQAFGIFLRDYPNSTYVKKLGGKFKPAAPVFK